MTAMRRRRLQLVLAALIGAGALGLAWHADSAMTEQYRVLEGCWPDSVDADGQMVLAVGFWRQHVEALDLGPVSQFFFTRERHRILFYLLILCATLGWCGSICLRIVVADADGARPVPSWEHFAASLVLAALAGAILFLLLVSARLMVDPTGDRCIPEAYAYLSAVAGIAAGLFVVLFFQWFEGLARKIWGAVSGHKGTNGNA